MSADANAPTPVDVAAIRARAEAATPGPWTAENSLVWAPIGMDEPAICRFFGHDETLFDNDKANAEFIAHARTDVPALCAEVEQLRGENARIYGIAKMRERERDGLRGTLRFIEDAGCQSERAGRGRCALVMDPEQPAPCFPCLARLALRPQDALTPAATADA